MSFPIAVIKYPNKSSIRKKEFIWVHRSRLQYIINWKFPHLELEGFGHIVSMLRNREKWWLHARAQPTFLCFLQSRILCLENEYSSSVNIIKTVPHMQDQRPVLHVIIGSVRLTIWATTWRQLFYQKYIGGCFRANICGLQKKALWPVQQTTVRPFALTEYPAREEKDIKLCVFLLILPYRTSGKFSAGESQVIFM